MKVAALSLWEPWASLMATGAKTIETRGWSTRHRGPLLICAAKRKAVGLLREVLADEYFQIGLRPLVEREGGDRGLLPAVEIRDLNFGKAVALVDLLDCTPTERLPSGAIDGERRFGDFRPGRWAWRTRLLARLNPFPVTGGQGLFCLDVAEELLERVTGIREPERQRW